MGLRPWGRPGLLPAEEAHGQCIHRSLYQALSAGVFERALVLKLENDVLGNAVGLEALDGALTRTTDVLLKRKNNKRLIIDLDSTEDPAYGKQEGVAYNGHFAKTCFHPLFCFTNEGDCLGGRLRPGNVHSADGVLEFIKPMVERYRDWFKLFWLRGDAAFAKPEIYDSSSTVIFR